MNICVTGGAGFIGSHLVDRLIEAGHKVLVIDNLSTGSREFINPKATFLEMDIRDANLAKVLGDFQTEYVFHEAAQTMVDESMKDPMLDCDINLKGLLNVLDACLKVGVKKILMPSSAAVYGDLETLPLTEDLSGVPASCYGLTKLTTEGYLRIFHEAYGLPYICYRYANVYGPRQGYGGEGGVISIFCDRLAKGEGITIYGDGEQTRDFVHVDDVVEANLLGLDHDEVVGIINVSTGYSTSLKDMVHAFESITEDAVKVTYGPERLGDIKHSVLSTERAKALIGYEPHTDIVEGLKSTYAYFQELLAKQGK